MYKRYERNNMLREKRKHANYKPNRRLDAKSSRGMIYENEELRLRTININAEVERGQSEIKSLKREREQLRREIWTLRDEYDKLENLLRIKGIDPDEFLNQKADHGDDDEDGDDNLSECSECSCESCCRENCQDENASSDNQTTTTTTEKSDEASASVENKKNDPHVVADIQKMMNTNNNRSIVEEQAKKSQKDRNKNFDHLSTVSEENSEVNSMVQSEESIPINDLSAFLHKADSLSPLSYLQKLSPPLAHFENLNYDEIGGSKIDNQGNVLHLENNRNPTSAVQKSDLENKTNENQNNSNKEGQKSSMMMTGSETPTSQKKSAKLKFKHFFSPIRKKPVAVPIPTAPQQVDVYVNNAIASNMYVNTVQMKPLQSSSAAEIASKSEEIKPPMIEPSPAPSTFQTGGNLEELLYDLEAISRDIMNLQCSPSTAAENAEDAPKKPFRSELNLFLSYQNPNEAFNNESASSPENTDSNMPSLPEPMELLNINHTNPLYLQNLPSPFPSPPIPASPLTPPTNFKTKEGPSFDNSILKFSPLNPSTPPIFSSSNSIFCTVSAPSTPASDRKCIEKFCVPEGSENQKDKKKLKRVSIVNTKDDENECNEQTQLKNEVKDNDGNNFSGTNNSNHHSHLHKNHSHIHKRRASLDNAVNSSRHKNHRQISNESSDRIHRRESNRSYNSFKKRSRSDSTFGVHDEGGTSMSERYSNSIASSRESSTSLSNKSGGKRRISITSYESKKIPWCGCWGNSCI